MNTYKEAKQEIEREYREKLKDLQDHFTKFVKFQEGDIVLYKAHKYDFSDKHDQGHTMAIGVIGYVNIEDNDDIRYMIRFLNTYSSYLVEEAEMRSGASTCTIKETDVIMKLGSLPMKYNEFLTLFKSNE